jgi:uncharacterized protein (TIGR03067 family)
MGRVARTLIVMALAAAGCQRAGPENPPPGPAPADARADDATALQGEWRIVAGEREGKKGSEKSVLDAAGKLVVEGEMFTLSGKNERPAKYKIRLDPSKTPKAINLTIQEGKHAGTTVAGIYALDGDRLRMCVPFAGQDPTARPKDFATTDGDGLMLMTFERARTK